MVLCFYISGGRFLKVNNDKRFFIRVNFQMFRGCAGCQTTGTALCVAGCLASLAHSTPVTVLPPNSPSGFQDASTERQ